MRSNDDCDDGPWLLLLDFFSFHLISSLTSQLSPARGLTNSRSLCCVSFLLSLSLHPQRTRDFRVIEQRDLINWRREEREN
jgi:hypothetical protein